MQQRQQLSLFTAHNPLVRCRSGLIAQQLNKGREIMELYDLESILKRTHCKSYAELVEILYSIAELTQKTDEIERVVRVLDEIDSEDGEYDLS